MTEGDREPARLVDNWRAHWPVVVAGMCAIGTGAGLYQYVSSLFIAPLEAQFGWTRSQVTMASGFGLLGTLAAPFIGWLADRNGVRVVATVCILGLAAAYMGFALMTGAVWQFFLVSGLLGLVSTGTTSLVYSRPMLDLFDRHRGLAIGLVTCGLSLATLIFAPAVAATIDAWGTKGGYGLLVVLALLIGLPAVRLAMPSRAALPAQAGKQPHHSLAVSQALRTRTFWLLGFVMILVNIPASGVLTQFTVLLTDLGHDAVLATRLLSVFAGAVLAGRLLVGWLFDRLDARHVAAFVTGLSAAGCLGLTQTQDVIPTTVCVVAIGLMQGAESDILAYLVARRFGGYRFSTIYGLIFTAGLLASAAGIIGFGRIFDQMGGYRPALFLSAGMLLMAAIGYLCLSRRTPAADTKA